jgi:hypothetical protein
MRKFQDVVRTLLVRLVLVTVAMFCQVSPGAAQGTAADYQRARALRATYEKAAGTIAEPATWIEKTSRFWYRRAVPGGDEFVVVDAATKQKQPAFDHARLATALSSATGRSYKALKLPFARIKYTAGARGLELVIDGTPWTCTLSDYSCKEGEAR